MFISNFSNVLSMERKKLYIIIAGIVIIAIALLLINSYFTGYAVNENKIKIGIMTPTTGNLAYLGENVVRSAELSVKDLGYSDRVELIVEDSGQLGAQNSINSYRKLVDVDKVQIIIDGMTSDGTMAVAPLLENDKVVMITPLTGGENIDNASEYLFRNGPSDIIAGTKPAKDIYEKFGYKKVALLTDNAEYTLDISKHFRKTFKGEIVSDQIIIPDLTDYRTEVAKLIEKNPDAIVINTASGTSAAYLIKELYEAGNKKPIYANFLAYNENTLSIAGNATNGVYIYDPEFDENSVETQNFFAKYKETYGISPTIPFHTTGTHDAIKMSVEAVDNVGYSGHGQAIRYYLLNNIKNWKGMNGLVSFDANGNTQTGFVLKQVRDGKLVLVE